jgi:calcium-translocating P-type ATPase
LAQLRAFVEMAKSVSDLPADCQHREIAWHACEATKVLEHLGAGMEGLTEDAADVRLRSNGENALPEAPRPGLGARVLAQLNHVLIYVLIGAALLSALLTHVLDAAAILAVVVLNTIIGIVQEGRAERAMDAVKHLLAPEANVLRGGIRRRIPSRLLVPGDVVILEAGDRISADLRLLSARGLYVDESILTGEAAPVLKTPAPTSPDAPLAERTNMAFSGTLATAGIARGVVVSTSLNTELGRISGMVRDVRDRQSPLVRRMNRFGGTLTAAILSLGALILLIAIVFRGYPFAEAFMAVVGLSVAAIPEGLPAVLTIILALGAQRMARRNAIVRRMPAIETLGAVTIICSDKTGTMTKNQMTVSAAVQTLADARGFAAIALLASDAGLSGQASAQSAIGDPMDVAILHFAMGEGVDPRSLQPTHGRLDLIPFDAAHRFMASLNHWPDGRRRVSIKGAPEQVLAMCARQADGEGETALDLAFWNERIHAAAADGARVLAVALKEVSADCVDIGLDDVASGCVFLGLLAFEDPPRPEAIAAVADCHAAGVGVKMITGDHAVTARAIARRLGLKNTETALTGADLDALDAAGFDTAAREVDVFARVTPEHKLRLVDSLQRAGECVAMTGDGVNDAPALKQADVGLAMGKRGSDAAKEASDIVLADDNFATIERAIRAGRTVYDNLRKVILFELPTNGGEATVLVAAILLGVTLPITPLQILWVNMVTTVALSLALAFEPPEPGIMQRPPRAPEAPLLSAFLIWRIAFVSILFALGSFGLFWGARQQGADIATARTVAVNTLVVLQIFYLFSTRYLHGVSLTWRGVAGANAVLIAVGIVLALQALFTYAPPLQAIFGTRPVDLPAMAAIFASGVALLLIMELDKSLYLMRRRWRAQRRGA